jgi:CDP-4-dehydro-6-deoxyglucose reductase
MPTTWYEAPIASINELAPNVRQFILKMPTDTPLSYQAGQFITFDLPIGERRLQRWRSYSIAGAPEPMGNEFLELCIVRTPEGPGTTYLFDEVKVGTVLKFKGPDGAFYLPEQLDKDLVFICTGTGIAPFRSMLLDIKKRNIAHKKIHLIFGTRYESGILYREEMEALQAEFSDFEFDIALSKEPNWKGHKGYVHPIYMDRYASPRPDLAFYICGWSNMIDEAVENLLIKLGYDRTQIHYELYG